VDAAVKCRPVQEDLASRKPTEDAMKANCIGMDTHGKTTDVCCKKTVNSTARRWHVDTTIPALREVLETIPRPRRVTFEEGSLADWLSRELRPYADELIVSDPRRNGLIAKDGDKDDPIDAEKLCDLLIGGYLRAVHHPDSLERTIFKRQVGLYHDRVEHRVGEANKIIGRLKSWGVMMRESEFAEKPQRAELLKRLGEGSTMKVVKEQFQILLRGYDQAVTQEQAMHRGLVRLARGQEVIARLRELPGIGLIRASTFVAYVDTPYRFTSKQALWKYLGIGLRREKSGEGREYLRVDLACNRRLKSAILGAAQSVIEQGDNPFAEQYQRWLAAGISPRNARRNVARSQSAVMWGMWKNGGVYDPTRVGVALGQ
jgi:transposase